MPFVAQRPALGLDDLGMAGERQVVVRGQQDVAFGRDSPF